MRRSFQILLDLSVVSFIAAAALFHTGCSSDKPSGALSPDEIKISAGDLRSLSSVGAVLCDEYRKGNTTLTFFVTQADMLHEKVASVRRDLVAPASENDNDRQSAAAIGEKVDSIFVKLHGDPSEAERCA